MIRTTLIGKLLLGALYTSITVAVLATVTLVVSRNATSRVVNVFLVGENLTVKVADTKELQERGLSGRESLKENEGMLFLFPKSGQYGFWMKDMQFPIDIVWIRGGAVVGFSENAAPEPGKALWSLTMYYPPDTADAVLEVNTGFVAAHGLKAGDAVSLRQ